MGGAVLAVAPCAGLNKEEAMTSKRLSHSGANVPPDADDFKRIRGIGPSIAQRLYAAGILTFDQLAVRSPTALAELVSDIAGMSADLIAKKDWIGQAHALATEQPSVSEDALDQPPAESLAEATTPAARQHYATFTVELLLDEVNDVRRTRATHIQGGAEDAWAGWQAERLVDFFVRRAAMRSPQAEPALAVFEVEPTSALAEATPPPATVAEVAAGPMVAVATPPPALLPSTAALHVRALELLPDGAGGPRSFLRPDQPFEVGLTLDLADVAAPADQLLLYSAEIYAKDLHHHARRSIGEARGTLAVAEMVALRVSGRELPSGIYRLEAAVTITAPTGEAGARKELTAFREGGLIQIY
jgi:predicted flap endonuclease-1-like 5' DNA nuclease